MNRFFILAILYFLLPFFAHGQVVITEIMYDLGGPEGNEGDTDREWVEIYNEGESPVDLSDWRFVEGGSRHTFLPYPESNDVIIQPSTHAVIVIKPDVFFTDWPNFSGKILDSSFSLKNSEGELLSLRNPDGIDVDEVTYDPTWGAAGDGNSLQKINGEWVAASPTPGAVNTESGYTGSGGEEGGTNETGTENGGETETSSSSSGGTVGEPDISARIDDYPKVAIVGAPSEFRGSAYGLQGEPLSGAHFSWSFGDGAHVEGQNVFYAYKYPGEYVVVLYAVSSKYTSSSKAVVKVVPSEISISGITTGDDSFIELSNGGDYEVNLGGWFIQARNANFQVPARTFILPQATLRFSSDITGLEVPDASTEVKLLYPNGEMARMYEEQISSESSQGKPTTLVASSKNEWPEDTRVENQTPFSSKENTSGDQKKEILPQTLAQAGSSGEGSIPTGSFSKWLGALAALIFFSILGFLFVRKEKNPADEYKIIEEKQ